MKTAFRVLALLSAAVLLVAGVSACGGGVDSNSFVSIGGDNIKKAELEHFLPIAAQQSSQVPGQKVPVPDPPDFTKCVAFLKKNQAAPKKGQPRPSDATLKQQCKQQYENIRQQVETYLIQGAWIEGEAADRGIKISDKEVKKQFDIQRRQAYPTVAAYNKFLESSGYTTKDLLFQVKSKLLFDKIQAQILKKAGKVGDQQVADYYNKNKKQFTQPEQRSMRIIMTKDRARAEEALKALKSGQDWKTVAKKYSIDAATKNNGGVVDNVAQGQQEKTLDDATFSAKKGQIVGPVKTQFGDYVFQVTKITPGSTQPLAQVKAMIKQQLEGQSQQKVMQNWATEFQKKWKNRTECAKGFILPDRCKNAPKPKSGTTTTVSSPQG